MEARRAHNPKVVGSNPTPATKQAERQGSDHRNHPASSIYAGRRVDRRTTPSSLVDGFILNSKVEGKSSATIGYYQDKLGNFLWWCRKEGISYPTTQHIREFLSYLMDTPHRWNSNNGRANRPLSQTSIRHYYGCLRTFFNWLVDEGYMEVNPVLNIKSPRVGKKVITALSNEEVTILLNTFSRRKFEGVRNEAILMVLFDTGLRLSEVVNMQLEDINTSRQTILVTGKGDKQRFVRYGNRTAKALWKYLTLRDGLSQSLWVDRCGKAITQDAITSLFKRLQRNTGIRVHCHKLRHSYAISALRNGMSPFVLQVSLGHATLDMTRRYTQSLGFEDVYREHQTASPVDRMKRRG